MPLRSWASRREMSLLALLLALTLVRGMIYVAVIPPWQPADEPYHFLSARSPGIKIEPDPIASWRELQLEVTSSLIQFRWWDMVVFVPAVREQKDIEVYLPNGLGNAPNPINPRAFTYHLLGIALQPVRFQDVTLQLYWARLFSVLTNLGVVFVAACIGKILFESDPFGSFLLPLCVVFSPSHTAMMSAINDANPAELLATIALLFLVLILVRGLRWSWVVAMTIFTVLAVSAKPTTFYLIPILLLFVLVVMLRKVPGRWKLLAIPAAVIIFFVIRMTSHRLDRLIMVIWRLATGDTSEVFTSRLLQLPFQRSPSEVVGRFWVELGWHTLALEVLWEWVLLALIFLAIIGLLRLVWRSWCAREQWGREAALLRVSAVFVLCVAIALALLTLESARGGINLFLGRYLLGATLPIMTLLVIGWRELFPHNWRIEGLALMVSFLILLDGLALAGYAVPFFYPLWR
ncbi:MAG: DUF2142 domain-containing protein [Anaerolineae bacterium]